MKSVALNKRKLRSMSKKELINSYRKLLLRYRTIQQIRHELMHHKALMHSFERRRIALLELSSYLRGEIDFRVLSLEAKLLMRYLISCRRYRRWRKRFKIHPSIKEQLNFLQADLISDKEKDPILGFIKGRSSRKKQWEKWEDEAILNAKSDIAAAYRIGRSESAVKSRKKILKQKKEG